MNLTQIAFAAAASFSEPVALPDVPHADLGCMALNIYHEARGESIDGQLAVAHVTLNRVQSSRYPDTACAVVSEDRGPKDWDCQFSWWCDGKSDRPEDMEAFHLALLLAAEVLSGETEDLTQGSMYYLTQREDYPGWVHQLDMVGKIGSHVFLRRY
ncbi:cell wall hydrolase [Sulfitobacter sp. 1A15106]|uniref:cell wall hydrolase n=1 Tax=Sulfitobacter sp. 1A15106 TaxID=3368590 RepID=UPI003747277A